MENGGDMSRLGPDSPSFQRIFLKSQTLLTLPLAKQQTL